MILIAGPCAIESRDLTLKIAEELSKIVRQFRHTKPIDFYFKASFDKANRTRGDSPRGVGQQEGLRVLEEVALEIGVQTLTDIHYPYQASLAASVVDVLQIPAFLCRQTDLLEAAVATGKIVNVKKGQFLAPWDMEHVASKLKGSTFWFTERGTCFGYNRLVNDMTGIPVMQQWGKVVFDATHSVQEPGGLGGRTGGRREMVEVLARAAIAVGCDGLFFETHPQPELSVSDGPNMVPLDQFESLLGRMLTLRTLVQNL